MIKMIQLYILSEYGEAASDLFRDLIEGVKSVKLQTKEDIRELDNVLDSLINADIFQHSVEYNEVIELQEQLKEYLNR